MTLLDLLRKYLTLAEGEESDAPDAEAAGTDDDTTGDETLDDLIDTVEPEGGKAATGEEVDAAAIKEARRRAQEAENNLQTERTLRQAAEQRANAAPQTPQRDPVWEAEEAELAAAKAKGDDTSWLQWKINGNRTMRQAQQKADWALMQAQDVQDKNAFDRLEQSKPKVYKRYAEKVEKTIQGLRQQGSTVSRLAVLRLMIGDDLMNGNVKAKAKNAPVDRGRTQGARTDVKARSGSSERDKRRARLENQIL
jgi:hypothetical protein